MVLCLSKIPLISVTKLLHKYIQSFDLIFCAFIKSNFIQNFLITDINKIQIEYRGVAVFILCYVFVQLRGAKLMIFIAPCRPIISSFNYSAAEARSPLSLLLSVKGSSSKRIQEDLENFCPIYILHSIPTRKQENCLIF